MFHPPHLTPQRRFSAKFPPHNSLRGEIPVVGPWTRSHSTAITKITSIFALLLAGIGGFASDSPAQDSWPKWRGPQQSGEVQGSNFPSHWNEEKGILWKTEIPGRGSSTPVIAEQTAYLTSGAKGNNTLLAIDLQTGKIRWQLALGKDRGGKHKKASGSNSSPVIDDGHVYAYFRSGDLACVSTSGDLKWEVNLQDKFGEDTLWWDLGTSPVTTDQAVVVSVLQSAPSKSYVVGLDKRSGETLWKEDRNLNAPSESAQSYTTPLCLSSEGKDLVAVMGADHLTVHDAATGKTLATLGGFNPDGEKLFRSISSPVAIDGHIICPYARGSTVTCVNVKQLIEGKGEESIAWKRDDLGSDVPTFATRDGHFYVVSDDRQGGRGTVSCAEVATGKNRWTVKIPKSRSNYTSSPLLAGDHLYVTDERGTTHVIGPVNSNNPEVIASNQLDDDEPFTTASPVPYQETLLIRTKHSLYRIEKS